MKPKIINSPSPNYNQRPSIIDTIVLHYTAMGSAEDAVERLSDPTTEVSAHYCISKAGEIYMLVDEKFRAWHAGVSHWCGNDNLNHNSIGIELDNNGSEPFPIVQMESLCWLLGDILKRRPEILSNNIVAHSDIAPARKSDPGRYFDWKWLASRGFGLWYDQNLTDDRSENLMARLEKLGYAIKHASLKELIIAFKLHWNQNQINDIWCKKSNLILNNLITKLR